MGVKAYRMSFGMGKMDGSGRVIGYPDIPGETIQAFDRAWSSLC